MMGIVRFLLAFLLVPGFVGMLSGQEAVNPVVIGNARFSFVTSGLVRMEYAVGGKFVDDSTLFAVNRTLSYADVRVERHDGDRYTLRTPLMRIEYVDNGFPFGQQNLEVFFRNGEKEKNWKISHGTKRGNLGGAIETLDAIRAPVPLQEGVLSREGWYAIHDTNKELLKDGWVEKRDPDHLQDIYLFIYGSDYKAALKSLQAISGPVPMTRKYVHGSWYCRWWNYTADDYRELVRGYREHDFPLDIMVFDMGWHTQREARAGTGHAGNTGWTGYTWNRELIPDPEGLIREFEQDSVHVVLNEHPHDGIRDHESAYPDFMKAMGRSADGSENILFDAGDRKYMTRFMRYAHEESDRMGVAFWWLDWQQDYLYPVVRGTTMKHLPWLNHLYYNYSKRNGLRGAGFSRWAGWGDHRHPIQFSGDAWGNWEMLKFEIELTVTSGNAGCFFWAHDIGGFFGGKDPELYTRWTQFGLLNSSLRIHSVYDKELDRRPWLWGQEYEKAMREVYLLRARLMPYIYSSVRRCHTDMLPLNRAMYIDFGRYEEAYHHPQQFMFGDLLLGAPLTTPRDPGTLKASRQVWLPEGEVWYHLFTGKCYDGGQVVTEQCGIDEFPLYVKGGVPLPLQLSTQRMASAPLSTLVVRCYPGRAGAGGSYTLYEDDGLTTEYEKGAYAETLLECRDEVAETVVVIHPARGSYAGQLSERSYRLELPACRGEYQSATWNGKRVKLQPEPALNGYVVEIGQRNIREGQTIRLKK